MWVYLFNFGFTPLGQTVHWDTKHFILSKLAKWDPHQTHMVSRMLPFGSHSRYFFFSLILHLFFSSFKFKSQRNPKISTSTPSPSTRFEEVVKNNIL